MPTLIEAYPTIVRALAVPTGRREALLSGSSRFEALIAFVASRSLESNRGERLSTALAEAGLLEPETLATANLDEVADALRDARIEQPVKTLRLIQRIAAWYVSHRDGLESEPAPGWEFPTAWRDELAGLNGIGRATADALALQVFEMATYPVDRATYRIFVRHGWIDATAEYDEVSQMIVAVVAAHPPALVSFSQGMADLGRRFCKAAAPRCERCPLRSVLPPGGPLEADG